MAKLTGRESKTSQVTNQFIANVLYYDSTMEILVMAKSYTSLRNALHLAHPQLAERQAKNVRKREIAVKLRALRDARGLTQGEVAAAAGTSSFPFELHGFSSRLLDPHGAYG
ncbi:MAG TPA: hypothetical protein EYQ36_11295 [Sulfitobacter sp.]|nr:hypothetical protein [Sulfitobacter sp.]